MDLVQFGIARIRRSVVYAISGMFVFVLAAIVVTFLFLMRQGYRWARTLLTGGGVASVVYAGSSLFSVDRPPAGRALCGQRHRRLGPDRRGVFLLHRKDAHGFFVR